MEAPTFGYLQLRANLFQVWGVVILPKSLSISYHMNGQTTLRVERSVQLNTHYNSLENRCPTIGSKFIFGGSLLFCPVMKIRRIQIFSTQRYYSETTKCLEWEFYMLVVKFSGKHEYFISSSYIIWSNIGHQLWKTAKMLSIMFGSQANFVYEEMP